jgi:branched-chain amino acid transport system permease protein
MLVVGGLKSLSGAVIGAVTISFVAEFLHRIEQGANIGPIHIPARPGVREVGLAIIMLAILIWRPRGLTNGHELPWPRARKGGEPTYADVPHAGPELNSPR